MKLGLPNSPSHARGVANAPLGLVQAQWAHVLDAAAVLDIAPPRLPTNYEPGLYAAAVYTRLLRHRHRRDVRTGWFLRLLSKHTSRPATAATWSGIERGDHGRDCKNYQRDGQRGKAAGKARHENFR